MAITTVGQLHYGGVTFDALHMTKLNGTPEYDESGRVVKWIKWVLEVEGWIGGIIDSGTEMEDKRIKLTTPAQTLVHDGKGFGSLFVNRVGPPLDVNWGPKPEMLSWRPLGSKQGCAFTWRISFCIPECSKSRYTDIEVDIDGYTTRGIAGHVLIAQTRKAFTDRVQTTADSVYEKVFPSSLRGFQRTTRTRKISKDRNRLDFHFIDKELPVPLPEKMTTIQIEQSLSSRLARPYGFTLWDLRFSGSANCPAGQSKQDSFNAMFGVVQSKLRKFKNNKGNLLSVDSSNGVQIMPISCNFSDQLLGTAIRFDITYQLVGCIGIRKAIEASNMYLPDDGLDYDKWAKSNENGPAHPRGYARMEVPGTDEVLIDLCTPPTTTTSLKGSLLTKPNVLKGSLSASSTTNGDVPPESSWLFYENALEIQAKDRVAVHKKLPAEDTQKYATLSASLDPLKQASVQDTTSNVLGGPKPKEEDVIQELGPPSYRIIMKGKAQRLGHPIPIPELVSINGVKVTRKSRFVGNSVYVSVAGATPINIASWFVEYVLPSKFEGQVPNLSNPMYDTDGGKPPT